MYSFSHSFCNGRGDGIVGFFLVTFFLVTFFLEAAVGFLVEDFLVIGLFADDFLVVFFLVTFFLDFAVFLGAAPKALVSLSTNA